MNYEIAYGLINTNISLEKMIADKGKKISLYDALIYKIQNDWSLIDKCDVYIKVKKTDCPKSIRDNKTLNIKEFGLKYCKKSNLCKMNYKVWFGEPNIGYGLFSPGEHFPEDSKLVENTPHYFMLKLTLENIYKNKLYDKCDEMLKVLTHFCTQCRKPDWENRNKDQWQKLHNRRIKLQSHTNGNNKGR